jgi:hypothetical protein
MWHLLSVEKEHEGMVGKAARLTGKGGIEQLQADEFALLHWAPP